MGAAVPLRNHRFWLFSPGPLAHSSRTLRSKKALRSGPPLALQPFGFERASAAHDGPPSQGIVPATKWRKTMPAIGYVTKQDNGGFKGQLKTLKLKVDIDIVPNNGK